MYLDYFGLQRHPFRITPDTSLFFSGGAEGRGVVLDAMLYAIESGEGILKVVGEVGSGKTMLCRMLEEQLPESTEVVYLANPNLSPDDILYAIAFELKLLVRRDTSKLLVMQQLQNYLLKQHAANRKVLVIIEEAQGMPVETLEEIRLFSNLETHRDKLMQIILFGQPELDKNLSARHIRQLRERITHSFYLSPLDADATRAYIRFRLGAAGCPCPQLFTPSAEWLIAKVSRGLTRRINILADKALLAAFADNVLESPENLSPDVPPVVKLRHVSAAIRDSDYSSALMKALFWPARLAGAAVLAAVAVLAFVLWPGTVGVAGQTEYSTISIETGADSPLPAMVASKEPPRALAGNNWPSVAEVIPQAADQQEQAGLAAAAPAEKQTAEQALPSALRPARPGFDTLTQQRLLASIEWLRVANPEAYTIQFMSGELGNLDFAERFLEELRASGLLEDSYFCMSSEGDRSYWTVKHKNFAGVSLAQAYIESLPAPIQDYRPFVQNMSAVECNINSSVAAFIPE
jgi:type II secretory pathway predicted ATPase ExeA